MAGLVDRVKESIRSRSRHRKSGSYGSVRESQEFNRASLDQERNLAHGDEERFSRSPVSSSSPITPARHVHSGSVGQVNKPLPSEPAFNGNHSTIRNDFEPNMGRRDSIPRKPVALATEHIPERSSSIRRSMPGAFDDGSQDYEGAREGEHTLLPTQSASSQHHTSRQMNPSLATNGHSREKSLSDTMNSLNFDDAGHVTVHNPNQVSTTTANTGTERAATTGQRVSEHIRLPEGFHTGHKESTHVTTDVRQPVTQERVHIQRTEIIQEAITRDIHMHHYYTYLQPVRVVEVLPARHFMYDPATGRKTEIEAPVGWVMPENLHPYVPDTKNIVGSTRHYLVNEQHPTGIPEAPPVEDRNIHHGHHNENDRVGRAV